MPRMTTILFRRGTAAEWLAANPILFEGEPAFEIDTKLIKIGDGTSEYISLPYIGGTIEKVATPIISPDSGYFTSSISVTITCDTTDAVIHYTTDGSVPNTTSATYSNALSITATTTIRAIAIKTGLQSSTEAISRTYTLINEQVAAPVFGQQSELYTDSLSVSITSATEGASIFYTLDGTTPSVLSTAYTAPFSITSNCTIKAIALKTGMLDSAVVSQVYTNVSIIPISDVGIDVTASDSTTVVSPAQSHHQGNLIAVLVAAYQGTDAPTITVSDTQSNTYTPAGDLQALASNGAIYGQWFYTWASETSDNTVTATLSVSCSYRSIRVVEIVGIPYTESSPVDSYLRFSTSSTPFNTTQANTIVLAGWHIESDLARTAGTGYTLFTGSGSTVAFVQRPVEYMQAKNKLTNYDTAISPTDGITGGWIVAFKGLNDTIQITTTGQTFQPIIAVSGSPTILWSYDDGTTSSSATPASKDFGSAGTHITTLRVTPWSALDELNVGYSNDDGGSLEYLDYLPAQHVSEIKGMEIIAPYLKRFAASRCNSIDNTITSLNFDNFVNLTDIECFSLSTLASISLKNLPSLTRLCVEACALTSLDLSEIPNLGDLRGALQGGASFAVNWGPINKLWHICIHSNKFNETTRIQPWSQFPLLRETYYDNNNLTSAEVDSMLTAIDSFGTSWSGQSPFISVAGTNAAPSATGLTAVTNLQSRGWTVTHS